MPAEDSSRQPHDGASWAVRIDGSVADHLFGDLGEQLAHGGVGVELLGLDADVGGQRRQRVERDAQPHRRRHQRILRHATSHAGPTGRAA